ncbi:MAG: adenylyl-sulfate kinase [Nitrospirota bacterium]
MRIAIAVWLTGLPGSGKSSVADEVKKNLPGIVVLRMDRLRKIVTPEPTYSESERDIVYRALVFLAANLTKLGHDVIIDATGNLRKWRDLARQHIPGYIEVYLRCPLQVCMQREQLRKTAHDAPGDIYRKGTEGWPVPGITVPYEEPLNPEIIIDSDSTPVKEAAARIMEKIARR